MFLCFVKSEINFLAITTWENEDVMRKWDVVFCSNRFQAQLVAISSDSDQWEGLSEPQWPMRGWQVTHSDARLPGDCSNSDNNLSWVWGRVMGLETETNRDRDQDLAPAIDIQMLSWQWNIIFIRSHVITCESSVWPCGSALAPPDTGSPTLRCTI